MRRGPSIVLLLFLTSPVQAFVAPPAAASRELRCSRQEGRLRAPQAVDENEEHAPTYHRRPDESEDEETTLPTTVTTGPAVNRRTALQSSLATAALLWRVAPASAAPPLVVPTPPADPALYWPTGKVAFSLLPLAGTSSRRATIQETVVKDYIWTHDQIQGIVNVNVPVRQTVIRLQDGGGLWVHNPLAPTPQLIAMMRKLEAQYGPVQHIVLGTVALEHKATLGAFASYFPQATVWLQPGQWSFPVSIPIEFYGLVQRGPRLRELPVPGRPVTSAAYAYYAQKDPLPSWTSEIDYEVLGPLRFQSVGAFSETAFYHKATRSLIVTDTVCSVTADPPAIIAEDARALLFHARNFATERVSDSAESRRRGWRRMVQFGLVFFPGQIAVSTVGQALEDARHVPADLRNLGDGAVPGQLYPWSWASDSADQANFDAISEKGRLFCPPILTKLILDREPAATLAWVDRIVERFPKLQRVLPSHLNGNVSATAREFSAAFDPLRSRPGHLMPQRPLAEDLALLQQASDLLTRAHIVGPPLVCDGEPARVQGRFAKR
jgi:hypothetical protein